MNPIKVSFLLTLFISQASQAVDFPPPIAPRPIHRPDAEPVSDPVILEAHQEAFALINTTRVELTQKCLEAKSDMRGYPLEALCSDSKLQALLEKAVGSLSAANLLRVKNPSKDRGCETEHWGYNMYNTPNIFLCVDSSKYSKNQFVKLLIQMSMARNTRNLCQSEQTTLGVYWLNSRYTTLIPGDWMPKNCSILPNLSKLKGSIEADVTVLLRRQAPFFLTDGQWNQYLASLVKPTDTLNEVFRLGTILWAGKEEPILYVAPETTPKSDMTLVIPFHGPVSEAHTMVNNPR